MNYLHLNHLLIHLENKKHAEIFKYILKNKKMISRILLEYDIILL